jgi:hypothetical protein
VIILAAGGLYLLVARPQERMLGSD